ncbi:hypothetical protein Acr_27g0009170 [Actinidia rufa]|uniref:Uncharacterized protein n=1 Tax=Actinidia rufa TaxID=165716 RepID=A0A7J0H821_9ERIC|nr:hypothetical protein Acr_27g0009170 [Actinidia rufa]
MMSKNTLPTSIYSVVLTGECIAAIVFLTPAFAKPSPSSEVEAKALLNSSWWGNFSLPNHCELAGIRCNQAGSVVEIYEDYSFPFQGNLEDMNWSALRNLENLHLSSSNLSGSIPSEIGALSKLTHLELSGNHLQDVLDPRLEPPTNPIVAGNIALVAALAFACLRPESRSRSTMQHISQAFLSCKKALATPLRTISLRELWNQETDFIRLCWSLE